MILEVCIPISNCQPPYICQPKGAQLINKANFVAIVLLQRPESVKIEAQDVTGAKIKVKLSGLPARVFQHEFDHLLVCV